MATQRMAGRTVRDWNDLVVGEVLLDLRHPRTRALTGVVVHLSEGARARLGTPELAIPVRCVFGVRRDDIILDRPLEALPRADRGGPGPAPPPGR